jgi:PAS domain S-box-containing protein
MARYMDVYPSQREVRTPKRRMLRAAGYSYAAGVLLVGFAWLTPWVFGTPQRVPWGWTYVPGPALLFFASVAAFPPLLAVAAMMQMLRSRVTFTPRPQRILLRVGALVPVVAIIGTDFALPLAGVTFPRLGSTAFAFFGVVALGVGLRYGLSVFSPMHFSSEILDTLDDGVIMTTPGGAIRRANRGLLRLTGLDAEEVLGADLDRILERAPGSATDGPREANGFVRSEGGERVPVAVAASPLRDQRGHDLGEVVVVRDMREIEEMRRRMLTQSRLVAVGELAAGLAHEINNPLAFVRANLAQLERNWDETCGADGSVDPVAVASRSAENRELIEESIVGVDRAAEIVRGVRRFTHSGVPVREDTDLNELLEDAVSMLRPRLREGDVTVELRTGALPPVRCASQELRQTFLNLIRNAIDATGGKGRVTVTSRAAGDQVAVDVHDDGGGIPPELFDRIFDPFFTTKGVGEGTGLGLAISWQIVQSHGGHIQAHSDPGGGTTFTVYLPAGGDA